MFIWSGLIYRPMMLLILLVSECFDIIPLLVGWFILC